MHPVFQRAGIFLSVAVAITYAIVTFRGPNGIPALTEKWRQIAALQEENATLAADNRRLATRVDKLGKDRGAQQLEIRKKLKLIRPGETQFMLPEPKPEQAPQ